MKKRAGSSPKSGFRLSFIHQPPEESPNQEARRRSSTLKEGINDVGSTEMWSPLCLEGHRDIINCLLYLGCSRIASGSDDGTLVIWDTRSGKMINQIKAHKHAILCMTTLHPNRKDDGQDQDQDQVQEGQDDQDSSSPLPQPTYLVTGSIDKTLKVWDLETFECITTLTGHTGRVSCVVVLENITPSMIVGPDESRRMSGMPPVDSSTSETIADIKHDTTENTAMTESCANHHPTSNLTNSSSSNTTTNTNSIPTVSPTTTTHDDSDTSTNTSTTTTGPTTPTTTTNENKEKPLANSEKFCEATQLFCSGGSDGVLIVWSIRGKEFQIQRQENDHLNCLLQVQNYLITGSNAKYVLVYDLLSLSYKTLLSCHRDSVRCLMKVTENFFLSGSLDGIIRMWDVKTFLPVVTLEHPKEYMEVSDKHKYYSRPVVSVARLCGDYFVAAIGKGFKVFDASLKVCVEELPKAHKSVIVEVIPLMGGIDFITCSEDSTIKIWSIATVPPKQHQTVGGGTGTTGVEFCVRYKATLTKHQMAVRKLCAFSEFSFASGGADNKIFLWRHSGVTPSFERRSTMAQNRSSCLLGEKRAERLPSGGKEKGVEDFVVKKYNSFRVFDDYEPDGFHAVSVAFEKYSVSETILDYVKGLVYDRQMEKEEILQLLMGDGHGKSVLRNVRLFLDDCDDA